jgi:hypothetical protein
LVYYEAIGPRNAPEVLLTEISQLEMFQNLVNLAASDGKFTEEEVLYLVEKVGDF